MSKYLVTHREVMVSHHIVNALNGIEAMGFIKSAYADGTLGLSDMDLLDVDTEWYVASEDDMDTFDVFNPDATVVCIDQISRMYNSPCDMYIPICEAMSNLMMIDGQECTRDFDTICRISQCELIDSNKLCEVYRTVSGDLFFNGNEGSFTLVSGDWE